MEEWGWIDKSQKGILKDLIISGNPTLKNALDKFSGGDSSELQDLIRQGIFSRRHSVDLLDGLDLDFLAVDNHAMSEFGNFHDQPFSSNQTANDHSSLLPGLSEDMPSSHAADWFDRQHVPRSSSVASVDFPLVSFRKNSLLSGDLKDWAAIDFSDGSATLQSPEIFDDVDLSMYEVVAANLQKTNPSRTKVSQPQYTLTCLHYC